MENETQMTEQQSYLQQHLMSIPELEVGQIVTGTVVQTNDESVLVDIGYKSEGKIPVDEFMELPKLGDKVAVTIVKLDDGRGQVVVSKKRAEAKERTEVLRKAAEDREPVLGKFIKVIKGGYEVDLGADYKGFCPLSKADIVRVEDPQTLIGKTDYFVIDKFHAGSKLKSVVSRREYLERKIKENKDAFFQTVQIGDVVQGEVKSFTSFGAFIDLGGFDGLLHINDMSWGHVTRPKDFVKKGIDVLDNETGFFMMVESGKIDWAGHANDALANIYDTIAFDEAIEVAVDFAKNHPDETLIVVTGDHETGGMTIGYAATGYNTAFDILRSQKCSFVKFDSLVEEAKADGSFTFSDMMAMVEEYFGLVAPGEEAADEDLVMNEYEYAKLQKAYEDDRSGNVDGYEESLLYGGYNPISVTLTHIINNKAGIGWTSYAHTGLPVPVYAYGEGAELFVGAYDNTEVAHKLMDLTDAR